MRLFELHRTKITNGRVATYPVAEGVEFTDNTVVLRWLGPDATSVMHNSMESVARIHLKDSGLSGAQSVVWIFEQVTT